MTTCESSPDSIRRADATSRLAGPATRRSRVPSWYSDSIRPPDPASWLAGPATRRARVPVRRERPATPHAQLPVRRYHSVSRHACGRNPHLDPGAGHPVNDSQVADMRIDSTHRFVSPATRRARVPVRRERPATRHAQLPVRRYHSVSRHACGRNPHSDPGAGSLVNDSQVTDVRIDSTPRFVRPATQHAQLPNRCVHAATRRAQLPNRNARSATRCAQFPNRSVRSATWRAQLPIRRVSPATQRAQLLNRRRRAATLRVQLPVRCKRAASPHARGRAPDFDPRAAAPFAHDSAGR